MLGYEVVTAGATGEADVLTTPDGQPYSVGATCCVEATCPDGKQVIGGGSGLNGVASVYSDQLNTVMSPTVWAQLSEPRASYDASLSYGYWSWRVCIHDGTLSDAPFFARAVCAIVSE